MTRKAAWAWVAIFFLMVFAGCQRELPQSAQEDEKPAARLKKQPPQKELILNLTELMNLHRHRISEELDKWHTQNKIPFHHGNTIHGKTHSILHHPLPGDFPNTITFEDVSIQADTVLKFSTGVFTNSRKDFASDGVTFVVLARVGDENKELYRDTMLQFDTWKDAAIGLGEYGPGEITIELRTEPFKNHLYDWAVWGNPRLVTPPSLAFSEKAFESATLKSFSAKAFSRDLPLSGEQSWAERGWLADSIVTQIELGQVKSSDLTPVIRFEILVLEPMGEQEEALTVEYLDEEETVLKSSRFQVARTGRILRDAYRVENSHKTPTKIRVTLDRNHPSVFFLKEPMIHGLPRAGENEKRADIILICLDTLRADRMGCYGHERDTSPNLDAFSREGFLFQNSYSNATWTLPSHASLFTSLYPSRHRIVQESWNGVGFQPVSPEHVFLTEILSDHLYATLAVTGGGFVGSMYGFNKGFDYHVENTRDLTLRGIDGLAGLIESIGKTPFFLFFHTYAPHDYFKNQPEYHKYVSRPYDGPLEPLELLKSATSLSLNSAFRTTLDYLMSEQTARYLSDLYDGGIAHSDQWIGALFQRLKTMGVYDTSWIIVTSDHGEGFGDSHNGGETLCWNHGRHLAYEDQIKVPLLVKPPRKIMTTLLEPQVLATTAQTIDIAPTILSMADITPPIQFEGKNLIASMAGQPMDNPASRVFIEDMNKRYFGLIENNTKLLMGLLPSQHDWMVNRNLYDHQLYNLKTDPGELENLAKSPESTQIVGELYRQIQEHLGKMPETPCSEQMLPEQMELFNQGMDREQMKRLRELGYL